MAEPREPDRFEAKAREVWRSCLHDGDSPSHEPIANALRREHDAALDEVRQYVDASPLCSQRSMLRLLDDLASPAAAPKGKRDTPCGGCGHPLWWHQWGSKEHAFCCAPLNVRDFCRCKNYEAPVAAPAAETCPEPPPGWETITTGPTAGCGNIATYRDPAPAQRAEAPDPERDRNRHNAMLVEAWRGEFGALCKALFPGHTGMIGWKHIHAKIADREALLRECEEELRELHNAPPDPSCVRCKLIAKLAARTSSPGAGEGT